MKTLLVLFFICFTTLAHAETRYNPYSDTWETVSRNEGTLKYNAYDDSWSYQKESSKLEYNAYENKYEWVNNEDRDEGDK